MFHVNHSGCKYVCFLPENWGRWFSNFDEVFFQMGCTKPPTRKCRWHENMKVDQKPLKRCLDFFEEKFVRGFLCVVYDPMTAFLLKGVHTTVPGPQSS